jgi:hypothetical protein
MSTWQELQNLADQPSLGQTSLQSYTDIGRVVRALAFQTPETVANALSVGNTQITLNQNIPSNWQVGDTLTIDANNGNFEIIQITGIPSMTQIVVTALTLSHQIGAPLVNATAVVPYPSAASRWFDTVTYNQTGFGYESVTDKKTAYLDNDGVITVSLSKPIVNMANVVSATFQSRVWDTPDTLDLTKAWIEDKYFLKIASVNAYTKRSGFAVVTYSGGYNPVPDDIVQAVTVMAARFYKERDSGYSDVIASTETGVMQYQKAMPADVKMVVDKYRRWTE